MYKMYPKFKSQLLVSKINFCAKFVTAERTSSSFFKTWLSPMWLNVQRSKIGIKWRFGECFKMDGSKFPNFRWNLGSGIFVGLSFGCATLKYLGFELKPNFILENTIVKAAEKSNAKTASCNRKMSITEVIYKVAPAIVKIEIEGISFFQIQRIPAAIISFLKGEKPIGYIWNSEGSGFIVKSDGLIVTNTHVAQYVGQKVSVRSRDGRLVYYRGVVEYVDSAADLAVVKINGSNLPVLKFADSKETKFGETVVAIGSGRWFSLDHVSAGIISGTQKPSPNHKPFSYILTDAPITEENNGLPLVNLYGEIVGVNATKKDEAGTYFVIPSCYIEQFLENANKKEEKLELH